MRVAYLGNFGPSWSTENHVARSLELNGHEVTRIQEGDTPARDVAGIVYGHDQFWWTQTYGLAVTGGSVGQRYRMLEAIRSLHIPSVGYHLDKWWDLPRVDQIDDEPFFRVDHLFTADGGHVDDWKRMGVNHYWMPPGVFEPECVEAEPRRQYETDLVFVGSWQGHYHPEWKHRDELVRWLRVRYRKRVAFYPKGRQIRGEELARLYASSKIVIGDSCMLGPGWYWSDRIPETLGRSGFLLHPRTAGLDEHFKEGEHLGCWDLWDWSELASKIDHYLAAPEERDRIRRCGREHVLRDHTYTRRTADVIRIVEEARR